jgi:hypothetical protein
MARGAVTKRNGKPVLFWVPEALLPALDQGVHALDLDRSKFIRQAIREKLTRLGVDEPDTAAALHAN